MKKYDGDTSTATYDDIVSIQLLFTCCIFTCGAPTIFRMLRALIVAVVRTKDTVYHPYWRAINESR